MSVQQTQWTVLLFWCMYRAFCTVCFDVCTVHFAQFVLMYVPCILHSLFWCMYRASFTVCFDVCTVHLVQFVLMYVPCILYSLFWCMHRWNNSAPTGRIFMKFDIWRFLEKSSRKFKFHCNPTRITAVLYMKTNMHFSSHLSHFFLDWEMFQAKVVEKINKHVLSSVSFFSWRLVPFMR